MKTISLIVGFVVSISFLYSQQSSDMARFSHYTSSDGLSQQVVRAIVQDKDGFIWFGTEDGLNKFDGYNFKVYRSEKGNTQSLPDNFIYTLCPSRDGSLWVGTNNGGFAKYQPESDNFITYINSKEDQNSVSSNRIEALYEDNSGNLWIGTNGGGLNRFDIHNKRFKRYTLPEDENKVSSVTSVVDMAMDKKDNLWIRTYTGFVKLNTKTNEFTPLELDFSVRSPDLSGSMYIDNNDDLWATFGESIIKINTSNSDYSIIEFKNYSIDGVSLIDIEPMDDNFLWISDYNGVFLFNKNDYSVIAYKHNQTKPESLLSGGCISLLNDSFGSLWVGTNSKGISKLNLNLKKFNHYNYSQQNPSSITGNVIRALLADSKDNLWVSVDSKVNKLTKDYSEMYLRDTSESNSELENITPTCFLEDKTGNIWIGTWGFGIKVLKGGDIGDITSITAAMDGHSLRDSIIQALFEDKYGNIWIGTESGLDMYNPKTKSFRYFDNNPENTNSLTPHGVQANCITEDIYGNIWVGTWGGLTRIIPTAASNSFNVEFNFVQYTTASKNEYIISDNRVISLMYDANIDPNIIYAGTYGSGLNKLSFSPTDQEYLKVDYYSRQNGLPNDVIYTIQSDIYKNIWLSTNNGLAYISNQNDSIISYDVNDGLQDNQFYWGAATKTNEGELFFGGINGINSFYPHTIKKDKTLPEIVLTDLKIFNKSVEIGNKYNNQILLGKHINYQESLILNHNNNVFTIDFSGLHYSFPQNNSYKYRLEGFEENWSYSTSDKRSVTYTNLDAGKYTLEIYASNYDGIWSKYPKKLQLIIKPPFWETLWFRSIIVSFILFLAFLVYKKRMEKVKHDKQFLEAQIKEAKEVLSVKIGEVENQKKELLVKEEYEKKTRWQLNGLSKFSELIRSHQGNVNKLTQLLLSNMVDYVDAAQAAMYLLNDEDKNNPFLELIAKQALAGQILNNKKVSIGEGLVGTCFKTRETIKIDEIPKDYIYIESGLGKTIPTELLLFPIKYNETCIGVLEITSYSTTEEYIIEFIEKFIEITASSIASESANQKLHIVLDDFSQLTEKLMEQEEEMKQNIEELKATQEQSERKEKELLTIIDSYKQQLV